MGINYVFYACDLVILSYICSKSPNCLKPLFTLSLLGLSPFFVLGQTNTYTNAYLDIGVNARAIAMSNA